MKHPNFAEIDLVLDKEINNQEEWEEKINRAKKVRKDWKDRFKVEKIQRFNGSRLEENELVNLGPCTK